MAVELGTGFISLTVSAKGLGKEIQGTFGNDLDKHASDAGDRAGRGFTDKFRVGLGGIAAVVGGAFAAVQAGNFLKGTIDSASNLEESMSKVNVVFEDGADEIIAWSENAATGLGQSQQQALEAAGTYGNLFRAMGIGTDASTEMSKNLVGLAGDLASFNNASPEDVLLALRSGLAGETEPLKQFGVNLNEARIQAEALRLGLGDTTVDQAKLSTATESVDKAVRKSADALSKYGADSIQYGDAVRDQEQAEANLAKTLDGKTQPLDAAAKAQAAYSLILADTTLAQGDFARTSDGLANTQRILGARFEDLKARIGSALLPVVLAAANLIGDKVIPAFERFGEVAAPVFKEVIGGIKEFVGALRTGMTEDEVATPFERVAFVVRDLADGFRTDVLPALKQFGSFLANIDWRSAFGSAVDFIAPLIDVSQALIEGLIEIGKHVAEIDFRAVFDRAVEIIGPIAKGVQELGTALIEAATQALPPIVDAFDYLAFTVLPPVLDVVTHIAAVVADVLGAALIVVAPLVRLLGDNMEILVPALLAAVGAFVAFKAATAVVGGITTATSAISTLKGVADTFGVSFSKAALEAGKQTSFGTAISSRFNSLKTAITGAQTAATNLAKASFTKIKAGLTSIATSAKAAASALLAHVKAAALWVKQAVITAATAVKQAAVWVAQRVAMIATTVATHAYTAAQWLLNAALTANPIGLIIAGVVALGAALFLAYQKSETFRNVVDAIGAFFRDVLWPAIKNVAEVIGGALVAAWGAVKGVLDAVWPIIQAVGTFIIDVWIKQFEIARDVISKLIPVILDVALAVGGFLVDAFNFVRDAIDKVWPVIQTVADFLGPILKAQIDVAIQGITTLISWFAAIIDAARNVYDTAKGHFDSLVSFITGLPGRIKSAASGMFDGIRDAFKNVVNSIIDIWNGISFTIGGGSFLGKDFPSLTLDTPNIDHFAKGGVITTPTIGLLGETARARPEIVSPQRLMADTFRHVLDERGNGRPQVIQVQIDGRTTAEVIVPHQVNNERSRR